MNAAWRDNYALARQMFSEGHRFENVAAEFFRAHQLTVEQGERVIRNSFADHDKFADETDLIVEGKKIEVKSRNLLEWPSNINLCSLRSWQHKASTDAWVMLSQVTGEMICASGAAARRFSTQEMSNDSRRGIEKYGIVRLAREHFKPVSKLIDWLKGGRTHANP